MNIKKQGRSQRVEKGAKATFQLLAKRCVSIYALENFTLKRISS